MASALPSTATTSGSSLTELHAAVDGGTPPAELALRGVSARIGVSRRGEPEEVEARNVAAFLPGSDPRRKDEWILIGGHHDHVGGFAGAGDSVFNGADDNASGTSGVLELARAFAAQPVRPARSLAFVTFSAEEKGLLGSRALLRETLAPRQVVFMLNLDMIGRNPDEAVRLYGDGYVKGLGEIVEAANAAIDLDLDFAGDRYAGNSDHDSFYREDVPFMFFFTGVHEDYHQLGTGDVLTAFGGTELKDPEEVGRRFRGVEPGNRTKLTLRRGEDEVRIAVERAKTGFMGVFPGPVDTDTRRRFGLPDNEGVLLRQVAADGPSAKAGLEDGDIVLRISGRPVSPDTLTGRLMQIGAGETVELMVLRRGERKSIPVTLGERPPG